MNRKLIAESAAYLLYIAIVATVASYHAGFIVALEEVAP